MPCLFKSNILRKDLSLFFCYLVYFCFHVLCLGLFFDLSVKIKLDYSGFVVITKCHLVFCVRYYRGFRGKSIVALAAEIESKFSIDDIKRPIRAAVGGFCRQGVPTVDGIRRERDLHCKVVAAACLRVVTQVDRIIYAVKERVVTVM